MPTIRIPLCQPIGSRTNNLAIDSRSSNCYFETHGQIRNLVKRPGRTTMSLTGIVPGVFPAQGLFAFNGNMYSVVNNILTKITSAGVCSTIGTLVGTSTNNCSFNQTATVPYMVLHNQTNLYSVTTTGTFITTPQTVVTPLVVSTGGTGYAVGDVLTVVGGTGTAAKVQVATLSGSSVATVTVYSGGNYTAIPTNPAATVGGSGSGAIINLSWANAFIPTQVGSLVPGIVYLDGYVFVATQSGRIYNSNLEDPTNWNALNYITASGEPDNLVAITKHFNYLIGFGEWSTEFFTDAGNATGSPLQRQDSYRMEIGCANGFSVCQLEQAVMWVGKSRSHGKSVYLLDGVSPLKVSNKYIENYLNADTNDDVTAYSFKIAGHTFYVMTLRTADLTFVYDLNEKEWYHWSTVVSGVEHYFRPVFYTEFNSGYYAIDDNNGSVYILSTSQYQDSGSPIYFRSTTELYDAGSTKRKFYPHLEIVGDKTTATMSIRHTDNDYSTWSNYRTVDLSAGRSQLWNLGSARRRAWDFLCTDNSPLRLVAAEIDFDIGGIDK